MPPQDPYGSVVLGSPTTAEPPTPPDTATSAGRREAREMDELNGHARQLVQGLRPGRSVRFTAQGTGTYSMVRRPSATAEAPETLETGPIHLTIAPGFIESLPDYNLNQLAPRVFWKMAGLMLKRGPDGRYIFMDKPAVVTASQAQLATMLKTSRQRVNEAMGQLTLRSLVWPVPGRSKYQLHPEILYFGSSEAQSEAIGVAKAALQELENRAAKKAGRPAEPVTDLPEVPVPGTVINVLTADGVTSVVA